MRGHLFPAVVMIPFSVLNASDGRPWMFQSLTWVGLAMKSQKLNSGETGMRSLVACNA